MKKLFLIMVLLGILFSGFSESVADSESDHGPDLFGVYVVTEKLDSDKNVIKKYSEPEILISVGEDFVSVIHDFPHIPFIDYYDRMRLHTVSMCFLKISTSKNGMDYIQLEFSETEEEHIAFFSIMEINMYYKFKLLEMPD